MNSIVDQMNNVTLKIMSFVTLRAWMDRNPLGSAFNETMHALLTAILKQHATVTGLVTKMEVVFVMIHTLDLIVQVSIHLLFIC